MLFRAQFRTCGILGKNEMEWQNYLSPKSRMEPCESRRPLYLFSHPTTLDLEEAAGDGRAGLANLREYSGKIKMVKERLISIPRQNDLKVSLPALV